MWPHTSSTRCSPNLRTFESPHRAENTTNHITRWPSRRARQSRASIAPSIRALVQSSRPTHLTAALLLTDAVFHGVFDEGLEQQWWQANTPKLRWHVNCHAQAMLEPRALDIEVRFDDFEFPSERGEFTFRSEDAARITSHFP